MGDNSGEEIDRDFGTDMYSLLYLKWITNKVLLYSTGNSAQCCVPAWMGGEFRGELIHVGENGYMHMYGREWIHPYAWLNHFPVKLKLSQHFSSAIL